MATDLLAEIDSVLGDMQELEQTENIYKLHNSDISFCKLTLLFYKLYKKGVRKIELNVVRNFINESYQTCDNRLTKYASTGIIKISRRKRKYYNIFINNEIEERYVKDALERVKSYEQ